MKKSILFLGIFLFALFFQKTQAQVITLHIRQADFAEIFRQITQQTGVRFSYESQLFDEKTIEIDVQNQDVNEFLETILPSKVQFEKVGNHVVLFSKDNSTQQQVLYTQKIEKIDFILKNEIDNDLVVSEKQNLVEKNISSNNGMLNYSCLDSITKKIEEEMKNYFAALLLTTSVITADTVVAQSPKTTVTHEKTTHPENSETSKTNFGQATFIYPLGSGGINSKENTYNLSFNMIGGHIGQLKGFELAGVFNLNKHSSKGFQIAGGFNYSGTDGCNRIESSSNVQVSGLLNFTRYGQSTQISGGLNLAEESPAQISGLFNYAEESVLQITGGTNITENGRVQISGVSNVATACLCCDSLTDLNSTFQLTGGVNVAKKSSCQIAGAVNITKEGGFQLGVLNIRDTADGVSLGVVNIVKKGGVLEFGVEGGEFIQTSLTFRSGTQRLYTILSAGRGFSEEVWAFGYGLGTAFRFSDWLGLNLEALYYDLHDNKFTTGKAKSLVQFRPVAHATLNKHFKIFAGPSANLLIQEKDATNVKPPYTMYEDLDRETNLQAWVGFVVGIKF